jgi:hypothetical protein
VKGLRVVSTRNSGQFGILQPPPMKHPFSRTIRHKYYSLHIALAMAGLALLTVSCTPISGTANSAITMLAKPGLLPAGEIELLAITEDHFNGMEGFTSEEISALQDPAERALLESLKSNLWWKADGSPAPKYQRNPLNEALFHSIATHTTAYRLFFRTKTNPADATWVLTGIGQGKAGWWFDAADGPAHELKTPDGRLMSDLVCFIANVAFSDNVADLTVSVASGPWESIAKVGVKGSGKTTLLLPNEGGYRISEHAVSGSVKRDDTHWSLAMNSEPATGTDQRLGTTITVVHNLNPGRPERPLEWDVRVIGLDKVGKQHRAETTYFPPDIETHAFAQATYEFPDLPLADAKEFFLQVRPFQSARFRHVALEPRQATTAVPAR